jgi:hypothetical protein
LFRNSDDSNALLGGEILVSLGQVNYALDQADDGWNESPKEDNKQQQIKNAQANLAKVKLVNTNSTEQDG